jgi:hypothetical protein
LCSVDNFVVGAAAGMLTVYNDQRCTDLTLLVENERLPAHKIVLIARSPFFAAMFAHEENAEYNKKEVGEISPRTNVRADRTTRR